MTTATEAPTATRRLERPRESAFRGVCSGIARATGTDPVLWRVLLVVLMFFDGLGLVLYIVGVVAIPREGERQSLAERLVRGPDRHVSGGDLLLLLVTVAISMIYLGHPRSIFVAAIAGALALLWWRGRADAPSAPAATDTGDEVAGWVAPPVTNAQERVWTPPPPMPPRPRSPLGGITLSVAAIVAGVLVLIGVTGTDMPVAVPIAAALAVVGIGLVAGSFFGRSWGLFLLAGLLTVALGVAAGVQPLVDDGVGDRDWSPTNSADYRLGAGKATLDLSAVGPSADITAHVGYGQLLVLVPAQLPVTIDAHTDYGDVELFGSNAGGRHEHRTLGDPEATVHLHLSVRAGEVKVVRS
jgi:phage shock protein PspC (stress-responsive transcriptional regulator)